MENWKIHNMRIESYVEASHLCNCKCHNEEVHDRNWIFFELLSTATDHDKETPN